MTKNRFTAEQLAEEIKDLKPGKFFVVETSGERTQALNAARFIGRRVTTKQRDDGKFEIHAIAQ